MWRLKGDAMYLRKIHVENYRNLENLELSFHHDVNYFVGENAVGKSNFLDLLQTITMGYGFLENDFTHVNRPVRITMTLAFNELEGRLDTNNEWLHVPEEVTIRLEQVIQEVYPRVYIMKGNDLEPVSLSLLRHALYVCHRDTSEKELFDIPAHVYHELGQLMVEKMPDHLNDQVILSMSRSLFDEKMDMDPNCSMNIRRLIELLDTRAEAELEKKYTIDNVRLIMAVASKLVAQIYMKVHSAATNLESLIITTADGKRFLPIFISVDEPELHLSPYLQRAVLNYYRQIATNENKPFLQLLKMLFNIDGLLGQLFIVTHSTDALVDDYRNIIRLYRNETGVVRGACGVTFQFPREVEKHLIMHFPEAKEALYSRCIILVEGETEYGSFSGFAKHIGVDFDYYGICLINARGEASIAKLNKLFRSFSIPTVALYDKDVQDRHGKVNPDVFYTDEICYEMDFVAHLLKTKNRSVMDAIVRDLVEDGSGTVTKDMLRRGMGKLGITHSQIVPRKLKNISDRRIDDLLLYYFSWFFSNKGVIVGRRISTYLTATMIPPVFKSVIERAQELSLGSQFVLKKPIDSD